MSLKAIVTTLYTQAHNLETQTAMVTLTRGLRIEVWKADDEIHLQLSRAGVLPSLDEWETVLKCWPHTATADPQSRTHAGRCYLASVVSKVQMELELLDAPPNYTHTD